VLERIFDNTSIPALSQALRFSELRHVYLANNVANVDTPGFKAMDLPEGEFREVLGRAIDAQRAGTTQKLELGVTSNIRSGPEGFVAHAIRAGVDARVDGNDVSLDLELAKLSKNSMEYQILSKLMARRFAFLREVVRERVGG
jgi:flagellar basal-body rod protein FlgB